MPSKSAAPSHHPYIMERSPWSGELSASQIPADWYGALKSCQRYFLNHGQHSEFVRTLCAFINIQLPHQKNPTSPITAPFRWLLSLGNHSFQALSLVPYIRRLVCTSNDTDDILEKFFGDSWSSGIGNFLKLERRNYLFSAKSVPWHSTKLEYDMGPDETVPCLVVLENSTGQEIAEADDKWSNWLAMEDWLIGPRSLYLVNDGCGERENKLPDF